MARALDTGLRAAAPVRATPAFDWAALLTPWPALLVAAFPSLIWALFVAEPVATLHADFAPAQADAESGLINRVYFPLMMLAALVIYHLRPVAERASLLHPLIVMLAIWLAWAGLTGIWGVEPAITLRRLLLQVFLAGAVVVSILAMRSPHDILRPLFWLTVAVVALNLAMIATRPPGALGHEGIYPHKNYLGAVVAILSIVALHRAFTGSAGGRIAAVLTLAGAAVLLVAARSKTSLALAVLAPALGLATAMAARVLRISPALTVPTLAIGCWLAYAFGAQSGLWDFEAAATLFFGDPTLTLRTTIWEFAVRMMEVRPLTGFGYEVFWGAGPSSPSLTHGTGFVTKMPHAHNGYIDLVLQTGYVGLVLFAGLMLGALHLAGRLAERSLALSFFCLSILIFILLYNGLESTFFRGFSLKNVMMLIVIALGVRGMARAP